MVQYANRTRRNVPNENRGPRCNLRISHPSRGHPTYLPHPGTAITTNRTKPRIWPRASRPYTRSPLRGEKTGQEEDRMVPSNLSPPGSTPGIEEPRSLGEMGRSPRRRIFGTPIWRAGLHGYTAKTDPGGVYHARLNPSSQKGEWNEILLPRSQRGGQ